MHITVHLNTKTHKAIRWCTPSIDPSSTRVLDPYKSDISVSHQSIGYPSEPSGIFKTAYDRAAYAYGADQTLFSVNGSTGSNYIVLRALSKQFLNLKVLAQRNIHKSVMFACEDYLINLVCLPPNVDPNLQIFLPNKINDFMEAIERESPHVLLITNPTYEGFTLDLKTLVKKVRNAFPDLVIFIEEAWGSHLSFSKKLPISAMEAGADICVQSTHKQGGALQQAGMIHWKEGRVNTKLLMHSYRRLSSSSPSYILLASLDAAREMMEKYGKEKIDYLLNISNKLSTGLKTIPGIRVIDINSYRKKHPEIFDMDQTKVLIDVSQTNFSGFELARILEEDLIIVEKYDERTLLFLTPFQATLAQVEVTLKALKTSITTYKKTSKKTNDILIPKNGIKRMDFSQIERLNIDDIEIIPLDKAYGRIAAENITPYPPGIPFTLQGEELTDDTINFYLRIKHHANCHIVAYDRSLNTIAVMRKKLDF